MKREEQIKQIAMEYAENIPQNSERKQYCMEDFIAGAERMEEVMIDKACEWLEEHLIDYWGQKVTDPTKFIDELKQAMEE